MAAIYFRGAPGVATAGLHNFGQCAIFNYTGDGIEGFGLSHGMDRTGRRAGRVSRSDRFGTTLK